MTPERYRRVTLGALLALIFIILTGGGVRLTGSGLGCSDWPTCEQGQFVAPLEYHAMIEFVNRLITGVVSVAVALAVLGSRRRTPQRRDLTLLSWGLVAGVVVQVLLGALVVKTHLVPAAVSAHFLVSIVLVYNALLLHHRAGTPEGPKEPMVSAGVLALARARFVATCALLFVGTLVTGAGPHSGDPGEVERLDVAITDIARLHAIAAWIVVALSVAVALSAARTTGRDRSGLLRREQVVLAALLLQGAIGYLQYAQGVPAQLVALHLAGAVAVFVAVSQAHFGLFQPATQSERSSMAPAAATGP